MVTTSSWKTMTYEDSIYFCFFVSLCLAFNSFVVVHTITSSNDKCIINTHYDNLFVLLALLACSLSRFNRFHQFADSSMLRFRFKIRILALFLFFYFFQLSLLHRLCIQRELSILWLVQGTPFALLFTCML